MSLEEESEERPQRKKVSNPDAKVRDAPVTPISRPRSRSMILPFGPAPPVSLPSHPADLVRRPKSSRSPSGPTGASSADPGSERPVPVPTRPRPRSLLPLPASCPRASSGSRSGPPVWTTVLIDKFADNCPTARLIKDLKDRGVSLAPGSITSGLTSVSDLFPPPLRQDRGTKPHRLFLPGR